LWEKCYQAFCDRHDIYAVKQGQMTKRLPTILSYVGLIRPTVGGERRKYWKNVGFTDEFKEEFEDIVSSVRAVRVNRENLCRYELEYDMNRKKFLRKGLTAETEDGRLQTLDEGAMKEEVRRLLSDGLGRTPGDVADELDMDLDEVEAILKELYDQGHVKKKRGRDGTPYYARSGGDG